MGLVCGMSINNWGRMLRKTRDLVSSYLSQVFLGDVTLSFRKAFESILGLSIRANTIEILYALLLL